MREIAVLNPKAGKGAEKRGEFYVTRESGDCRRFVREECLKDPFVHFFVEGGDGTLNEAVNGIMDAEAGDAATITAVPCGSGNDTVKTTDTYGEGREIKVDLIRADDLYSINMINIGFDCNVVERAARYKKIRGISGNFSYILGVGRQFFSRFGERFSVRAELADGGEFTFEGDVLLCAVANGQWCGGSFHNSPLSDMTDGTLEMILVKKMSRINFIRMIGKYKKARLVSGEFADCVDPRYSDYVIFRRIQKLTLEGCVRICADGEIVPREKVVISVVPGALRYVVGKKEKE